MSTMTMAANNTRLDDQKNIENIQNSSDAVLTSRKIDAFRVSYYAKLTKDYESHQKPVIKPWTQQKILEVIQNVKSAKLTTKAGDQSTSSKTYWHLRYDVIKIADEDILIMKKDSPNCPTVRVVPFEEYFDVLFKVHDDCGHGSDIDKIQDVLKHNCIVPRRAIELFVLECPVCQHKSNTPKIGIGDNNTRGKVDIIDMQSVPDGQFKWILNYQDLNTEFVHLRPLCSKEASEVAFELLKIFLEFGVPYTLQSTNGIEFTAKIIEEIVQLWPECKLIKGVSQCHTIQDNVEIEDVENMIWTWMRNNNTAEWVIGCFFVQYSKNTILNKFLGRSPFQALFQSELKGQLSSSQVTNESRVETENLKLPPTTSSSPNVLQSSPPYQKAKKRKITLQDFDTAVIETVSFNLSQTIPSLSSLCQRVKKQKTSLLKTESDLPRLETETAELSLTASSSLNTSSTRKYQNASYVTLTSKGHDTTKLDSDNRIIEFNQIMDPINTSSSPELQNEKDYPLTTNSDSLKTVSESHESAKTMDSPSNESTKSYSLSLKDTSMTKLETGNSRLVTPLSSPTYKSSSPTYRPSSTTYKSSSPTYGTSSQLYMQSSTSYQNNLPAPQDTGTQIELFRNKVQNITNEDLGGIEKILQYLKTHLPTTAIDHLFVYYAATFKTFPFNIQAELKVELAKLFEKVENRTLQNSISITNGTHTIDSRESVPFTVE